MSAWIEAGPADAPSTLVFLHGIGGGKKGFQSSVDYFASLGYRALAWDMPGYGDSPLTGTLSFASLAASLEQLLNAAHVKKAVLVGHSMGGMVALQAWAHCPQRIAGLVIAASSPAFGQQDGDFQQQFVAQRLAPLNAGKTMAQVADRLVPSMVAPHALPVNAALQDYPAGLALAHACMSAVPPETYRASLQALVTFEQRAALPSISVPTLCLAGEHDKTAPPEVLRRMAQKITGAQYECIPGVGHLMGFEQEAPFHQAILNFVRTSFKLQETHMSHNATTQASTASTLYNSTAHYMPISGEDYPLTSKQKQLMAMAHDLGKNKFAPRAAQLDRDAQFPFENYKDMKDSGLLALCVPEAHGGLGADYATYAMVSAEIGRWCGATALTFNMHVCTMMWSGLLSEDLDMTPEQRALHRVHQKAHFARVVNEGAIYAQPFSEGGAAAAGAQPFGTQAVKVEGGWRINGKKIFASLSDAADFFGVLCTEKKPDADLSRRDTLYLAVPRTAPGLTVEGDWDPLGMRATVSRNLIFKDVFVSEDAALMPQGVYFQAASRWPHMFMTLSPTYMGIAQAAYDFTVAYLRGEIPGTGPVKRRQFATKQIAVAEMFVKLEQTRNLFLRAIEDAKIDPPKSSRLRAYAAQYTIMENAQDIARLAIRTCGGQSMLKSLPLERLYRDARCGSLMLPWTAELCLDRLGRETLYEAGEKDE